MLAGGEAVVETYGYSDDDAFDVGLTCGGTLDVLVAPADRGLLAEWADEVAADEPVALATVVSGPAPLGATLLVGASAARGSLGDDALDAAVASDARGMLAAGRTGARRYGAHGERRLDDLTVFVQAFTPRPRMLVFGAIDFAAAVCRVGAFLGYRVTVCDARPAFATTRRFPDAHEVVCAWPHRYLQTAEVDARTVMCVLTHDPKFDVPLLKVALRGPAAYIGVMCSRRAHDDRLRRLREAGVYQEAIARLRSPIGLDLGGSHCRGDGGVYRGRDRPAPVGPVRPAAGADRRDDPPGRRSGRRAAAVPVAGLLRGPPQWAGPRRWSRSTASRWCSGEHACSSTAAAAWSAVPRPRGSGRCATACRSSTRRLADRLAASLRLRLSALAADACVVALVDQPLATPVVVQRLRSAHAATGASAAVAGYMTAGRAVSCCCTGRSGGPA